MQIHHLQLSAVGPFAGTHTIDFESLSAAGIFLLEGPTGAGKSTLIDAIVFGLYGQVAGGSSSNDRIRSGLVDGNTESYVDLVFETASGIYRVRRTPQFLRAKKRGTGLTKTQASVRLWQLSTSDLDAIKAAGSEELTDLVVGEFKSERMDEAGLEITRAIGLDRAQFVQTIVLPQGEFANFLKAKPEERRDLLQKVFGTEIYQRVQDELAAMRREVKAQTDKANAELDRAKTGFVTAAGLDAEQAQEFETTDPDGLLTAAAVIIGQLTTAAETTASANMRAQEAATTTKAALDAGTAQLLAAQRRTALLADQVRLAEQAPGIDQHRVDLAQAARAAVVLPAAESLTKTLAAADKAARMLSEATESALPVLGTNPPTGESELRTLATERSKDLGQQRGRLSQLLDLERELPGRERQVQKLIADLAIQDSDLAALTQALAERPALQLELANTAAALAELAKRAPADQLAVDRALDRVDACALAATTAKQLLAAQTKLASANTAATECIAREAALRTARISQIAGELGQQLEPDCPCPVCGSTEHPDPAHLGEDAVSVEQIEAAEEQRKKAETVVAGHQATVAQLTERRAAQDQGDLTAEVARAELEVALLAAGKSRQAESDLPAATAAVAAGEAQTQELRDQVAALNTAIAAATTTLELQTKALAADAERIANELAGTDFVGAEGHTGPAATIADLAQDLRARESVLDALLGALTESAGARTRVTEQTDHLDALLAEQQFESAELAQSVALTAAQTAELTKQIRAHEADMTRVQTALASPEIVGLPDQAVVDQVDLEELERAASESGEAARQMASAATTAINRAEGARTAEQALSACLAKIAEVLAQSAPVIRMADIAAGASSDNAKRLTLQTFVLLKRFEDVIVMANERLAGISDGRYELERSDDKEAGGGNRLGLALKVIDRDLDEPRDPKTLSGGETFYVSLCLALGLADVVTAETGGVELGTLFIDEGFGSLDPETLDSVLQVLATLRSGGRTVGVVSHVEALKQTILDGISVRHLPAGGSTLTVRA